MTRSSQSTETSAERLRRLLAESQDSPAAIKHLLKAVPAKDRAEVAALALASFAKGDGDFSPDTREFFQRARILYERLEPTLAQSARQLDQLKTTFKEHKGSSNLDERWRRRLTVNPVAKAIDGLIELTECEVDTLRSIVALSILSESAGRILMVGEPEDQREIAAADNSVRGVLKALDSMQSIIARFPEFASSLVDALKFNDRKIRSITSISDNNDKDGDDEPHNKLPLFRGKPHLTLFLDGMLRMIPSYEEQSDGSREISDLDRECLKLGLALHANTYLLDQIENGTHLTLVAHAIIELHGVLTALHNVLNSVDLGGLTDIHTPGSSTKRAIDRAEERKKQVSKGALSFEDFSVDEIILILTRLKERQARSEPEKTTKAEPNEKDKIRLQVYQKIYNWLAAEDSDEDQAGEAEFEQFVDELIELKQKLTDDDFSANSRTRKDTLDGNHVFTLTQGSLGSFELKRTPSANIKFEEIEGKTWRELERNLGMFIEDGIGGSVYTRMSPRGKLNNNTLVLGPYGCGKNEWSKALLGYSPIIGINTTTDRMMSVWHSRSEASVRELFELAAEVVQRYQKPAAINWDEFYLMPKQVNGIYNSDSILERMREALQSVLEGDTVYEGVALFALSNEPARIPVPLYRRFENVVVVAPLDAQERRALFSRWLTALPLDDESIARMDWEPIEGITEYASGAILGKVFDHLYRQFWQNLKEENPNARERIRHDIGLMHKEAGAEFGNAHRREIFTKHSNLRVSSQAVLDAFSTVIIRKEIELAIAQQRKWYVNADKMLAEAFDGKL